MDDITGTGYEQEITVSPSGEWRKWWPEFEAALKDKLERGFRQYGDGSFSRPPEHILDELGAEALDLAGWGLILWVRCQKLNEKLELLHKLHGGPRADLHSS